MAAMTLNGSFPTAVVGLPLLRSWTVSSNQLTGTLPSLVTGLPSLTYLGLNSNRLTGSVPSNLLGLTSLVVLDVNANQLSGSLPSVYPVSNALTYVVVQERRRVVACARACLGCHGEVCAGCALRGLLLVSGGVGVGVCVCVCVCVVGCPLEQPWLGLLASPTY